MTWGEMILERPDCPRFCETWHSWGGMGWDLGMGGLKSLQSNISMHILHTVLYTFPIVPTRRICLTIMSYVC